MHIYIYGAHPISWADLMQTCYFYPSFIVENAQILQPRKGGCKFVFLFSSFSLRLPFSALFCFFALLLLISKPKNCPYIYIYISLSLSGISGLFFDQKWPFRDAYLLFLLAWWNPYFYSVLGVRTFWAKLSKIVGPPQVKKDILDW